MLGESLLAVVRPDSQDAKPPPSPLSVLLHSPRVKVVFLTTTFACMSILVATYDTSVQFLPPSDHLVDTPRDLHVIGQAYRNLLLATFEDLNGCEYRCNGIA